MCHKKGVPKGVCKKRKKKKSKQQQQQRPKDSTTTTTATTTATMVLATTRAPTAWCRYRCASTRDEKRRTPWCDDDDARKRRFSSPGGGGRRRRRQQQKMTRTTTVQMNAHSSGEEEKTTTTRSTTTTTTTTTNAPSGKKEEEVVRRAIRSLMRKKVEEEEGENETRMDEYARTLVEASTWTINPIEEGKGEATITTEMSSSSSLLATSFALDALVLSRLFTLMRKREPPGSETMGIARQIVNISFLGLDTRTLRIRDWPRGTAIFDVQPKDCNEYLTPRMKLMNAKVTRGSSLRRVDFDFMSDAKSSDKKSSVEDALRKEGFREETPTIWICEELEELVNSEATKISDFVEEICDLMSRESECCGSVKGVDARLRNTIKALFAANGAMCSFTEEENGCVLFSAIKMRRSVREEEYYRNALMDAMEQIDEDGWED